MNIIIKTVGFGSTLLVCTAVLQRKTLQKLGRLEAENANLQDALRRVSFFTSN